MNTDKTHRRKISVITPLWNEEDIISELVERLKVLFENREFRWQWVAVDDGSSDRTVAIVTELQARFPDSQLICLSKNFGQQGAYRAGLDHADGDAIIFLDADMQDPPEYIPDLLEKWKSGSQLVVGCRKSRPEGGVRGMMMKAFHEIFFRLTDGAIPKHSGTFGLMDRVVAEQLKALPERNLFLPALRKWVGFKQDVIWYDRQARQGQPKQTYRKLFRYAWDGITSFSDAPIHLISVGGALICLLGFLYAASLVVLKLVQLAGFLENLEVQGFTTLAVAIFTLGGIQLLCLGVLGQYIAKVYSEVKGRPYYIVSQAIRGEGDVEK